MAKKREEIEKKEPTPTSASVWRKQSQEGHLIPLPSGNMAIVKSVSLEQLIDSGYIPNQLMPIAMKSLWSDTDANEISTDLQLHEGFLKLMNIIIPMALVQPKIVPTPTEGKEEITIEDVEFFDKLAIFNLAIQPTAVLKTFREQQEKRMVSPSNSEDLRNSSEQSVEDPGRVGSIPA